MGFRKWKKLLIGTLLCIIILKCLTISHLTSTTQTSNNLSNEFKNYENLQLSNEMETHSRSGGRNASVPMLSTSKSKKKCYIPDIDPFRQEAMKLAHNALQSITCRQPRTHPLTIIDNKLIVVGSKESVKYYNLIREDDFNIRYSEVITNGNVIDLQNDFSKISVKENGVSTINHIATVIRKTNIDDQTINSNPINILFIMIDSQSYANAERHLKTSLEFIKKETKSFTFKGHTINGDGTTAQLCAILMGDIEENMPEAKRGFKNAQSVDNWPFIFKKLKDNGFATMYSEDDPKFGTFHYRLLGFNKQPADHYMRPFWIGVKESLKDHCINGIPAHEYMFNYTRSFFKAYPDKQKFGLTFFSKITHNTPNDIQALDKPLHEFLKQLKEDGVFKDTFVFMMGDHGSRTADFRATVYGKLEERLPLFTLSVPEKFLNNNPNAEKHLEINSKYLTSHFDIHATLQHIIDYSNGLERSKSKIGSSLLDNIENINSRTCKQVGVDDHWCPCLEYESVNPDSPLIQKLANMVITSINNKLKKTDLTIENCVPLKLKTVLRAGIRTANQKVRKFEPFRGTFKDYLWRLKHFILRTKYTTELDYEIVLVANPSDAQFEATLRISDNLVYVSPHISRLNLYRDQPACIQDSYPHLRPYCFCKKEV